MRAAQRLNFGPFPSPTLHGRVRVEKFRKKYGANDVTKYYSKFDVAVLTQVR